MVAEKVVTARTTVVVRIVVTAFIITVADIDSVVVSNCLMLAITALKTKTLPLLY